MTGWLYLLRHAKDRTCPCLNTLALARHHSHRGRLQVSCCERLSTEGRARAQALAVEFEAAPISRPGQRETLAH